MTSSQCFSMAWPANLGIAGFPVLRYDGWLSFISAETIGPSVVLIAAWLAVVALVGLSSYLSSARANRQSRVVWDRYAEQELAKTVNSRRNLHADPQSQAG